MYNITNSAIFLTPDTETYLNCQKVSRALKSSIVRHKIDVSLRKVGLPTISAFQRAWGPLSRSRKVGRFVVSTVPKLGTSTTFSSKVAKGVPYFLENPVYTKN